MVDTKDMTGQKVGRLTVIRRNGSHQNRALFLCECECGTEKTVDGLYLRKSPNASCGCYVIEVRQRTKNQTHGLSQGKDRRIYDVFMKMKDRCENDKSKDFKNYGGRGIKVEWSDPVEFVKWAKSSGYVQGLTIERVDVNGNYSPENCTWITNEAQSLNRTNSRKFTYKGKTQDMRAWANEYGIKYNTLRGRLTNYGWDIKRALLTPVGGAK